MNHFNITLPNGLDRPIGGDAPCFIVAEIGKNWMRGYQEDVSHAHELINIAAGAGCNAVKFQSFRSGCVYADPELNRVLDPYVMPWWMIRGLSEFASKRGLVFFAACFSVEDVGLVDPWVPIHKIASCELNHVRLLDAVAKTHKPVIVSTGAATVREIGWTVNRLRENGSAGLALLQCSVAYPAPEEAVNLRVIPELEKLFDVVPGLSDHTEDPLHASLAAVAMGAKIIEKHVTLDRGGDSPDDSYAVEPDELKAMVDGIRAVERMLGSERKGIEECEREVRDQARRSVLATKDIAPGEKLEEGVNMGILRPGKRQCGISPCNIAVLEGKYARKPIRAGDGIWRVMTK